MLAPRLKPMACDRLGRELVEDEAAEVGLGGRRRATAVAPWPGRSGAITWRPASARRSSQPASRHVVAADAARPCRRSTGGPGTVARLGGVDDGAGAGQPVGAHPARRARGAHRALGRPRRPARQPVPHPGRGAVRRGGARRRSAPGSGLACSNASGPVVRVVADDHRSQARNRGLAIERLAERLAAALRVDPPRRPTKPTRGAVERRLDAKRRQAARKADRKWSGDG